MEDYEDGLAGRDAAIAAVRAAKEKAVVGSAESRS
jgi:hypothetical protein